MKKILAVVLIIFCSTALFALNLQFHLGLVSGFGIVQQKDRCSFGIDLESSFPVYAVASGYSGEIYNDLDFRSGFEIGARQFIGLDFYLYRTLLQRQAFAFSMGLDLLMGTETPIHDFEAVLKLTARADFRLGEKTNLFLSGGISAVDLMMIKGFKAPLVRIPMMNYSSILTGSKIGIVIDLS